MKESLQTLLVGVLISVVLGIGGYWFFENYTLQPFEEQIGKQGELASNDLYFARLLLKRMGIPTESHNRFETIPPSIQTVLVLDSERYQLSEPQSRELLAWVKRGGHLVTRVRNSTQSSTSDELTESTDTPPTPSSRQTQDPLQQWLKLQIGEAVVLSDDKPLMAQLPSTKSTLQVAMDMFHAIKGTQQQWSLTTSEGAIWLAHYTQGTGAITVLSDFEFMHNEALNQHDHAEFLWSLLHLIHTPEAVWLINDDNYPNLLNLMWRFGWAVILSAIVLFIVLIWHWMPRFGAIKPLPTTARRRFMAHLQVSGRFQWYQQPNGRSQLTHTLQHDLLQQGERRIREWGSLSETERHQRLGQPLQHSATYITHLIQTTQLDEIDFIHLAQLSHYWRHCTSC